MELMGAHLQQVFNGNNVRYPYLGYTAHNKKTVPSLNGITNLPDLEITPVVNTPEALAYAKYVKYNLGRTTVESESTKKRLSQEQSDIANLLKSLPVLNEYFHLYNKIGEGAYGSVYLATLRSSTSCEKFAVKHLTQNQYQSHIEREFRCLTEIGGTDNVINASGYFNNGDGCVTFIMPYLSHMKFSDYVLDMDVEETRLYMKNLFIALKRVHSFNVIHRDVKPGNFLYNRETKEFLLVDFGLAQILGTKKVPPLDENMPIDYSKKRKRKQSGDEEEMAPPTKRAARRVALKTRDNNIKANSPQKKTAGELASNAQTDATILPSTNPRNEDFRSPMKQISSNTSVEKTPLKPRMYNTSSCPSSSRKKLFYGDTTSSCEATKTETVSRMSVEPKVPTTPNLQSPKDRSFTPLVANKTPTGSFVQVQNSRVICHQNVSTTPKSSKANVKPSSGLRMSGSCPCSGIGAICSICSSRKVMVAPRAGTPGYRPPEVLLKYRHQTTAVDMWASGVMLLCILSGSYPFFKSANDLIALSEIMVIFGTEPVNRIAAKFGRRVVCSKTNKAIDLKKLCVRLRARSKAKSSGEKICNSESFGKCEECHQFIKSDGCLCKNDDEPITCSASSSSCSSGGGGSNLFPDEAYHLLSRLLDLDPSTRITAEEALQHPFLAQE